MVKTIQEMKIGDKVENHLNGKGVITHKTKRTIEVTFEKGVKVKNTYRYSDDYFWPSDF